MFTKANEQPLSPYVAVWLVLLLASQSIASQTVREVPIPVLQDSTGNSIRVAYVENQRFPGLSLETLTSILDAAKIVTRDKLGVEIEVDGITPTNMEALLQRVPGKATVNELSGSFSNWGYGPDDGSLPDYVASVGDCLRLSSIELNDYAAYIGLAVTPDLTYATVAETLWGHIWCMNSAICCFI